MPPPQLPSLPPPPPLPQRTPAPSVHYRMESLGAVKIIVAFLCIATLGNIALTISMSRPNPSALETASQPPATSLEEINKLKDELGRTRVSLASSMTDIGRLKSECAAVISRLANVTAPSSPAHSPNSITAVSNDTAASDAKGTVK